jgi:hypothetical protein
MALRLSFTVQKYRIAHYCVPYFTGSILDLKISRIFLWICTFRAFLKKATTIINVRPCRHIQENVYYESTLFLSCGGSGDPFNAERFVDVYSVCRYYPEYLVLHSSQTNINKLYILSKFGAILRWKSTFRNKETWKVFVIYWIDGHASDARTV